MLPIARLCLLRVSMSRDIECANTFRAPSAFFEFSIYLCMKFVQSILVYLSMYNWMVASKP